MLPVSKLHLSKISIEKVADSSRGFPLLAVSGGFKGLFCTATNRCSISNLNFDQIHKQAKEKFESKKLPKDIVETSVFACNNLKLEGVNVYGFDYDYTLACYKPSLLCLLYTLGRNALIENFKYPSAIKDLEYDPKFAVRGLHYDIKKGVLLKLDSFLQIQLGTVYRGKTKVCDNEVLRLYKNRAIPVAYVEGTKTSVNAEAKMIHLSDLFSVPEMNLLCNVAEYFERNHLAYNRAILFHDIQQAIGSCHPVMHKIVSENVNEYIESNAGLVKYLERLINAGKRLFLITNSPYHFVNKGMLLLVGGNWRDFFEVIIVGARKPRFFTDRSRPFRLLDEQSNMYSWDRVSKLEKGKIYFEGTVSKLQKIMKWQGDEVLYFGDHPFTDLADVTLCHGWKTGAIISELAHEIKILNTSDFKKNVNWLQMLTQLIDDHQDIDTSAAKEALSKWKNERYELRLATKCAFNEQFGSVFRTHYNPSYFSRRLFRFADIYTSNISNLLNYSLTHTFYPRRGVMPHEYVSYFM